MFQNKIDALLKHDRALFSNLEVTGSETICLAVSYRAGVDVIEFQGIEALNCDEEHQFVWLMDKICKLGKEKEPIDPCPLYSFSTLFLPGYLCCVVSAPFFL